MTWASQLSLLEKAKINREKEIPHSPKDRGFLKVSEQRVKDLQKNKENVLKVRVAYTTYVLQYLCCTFFRAPLRRSNFLEIDNRGMLTIIHLN